MKQAIDYESYYDDSSDEEDNIETDNHTDIEWFEERLESVHKSHSNLHASAINLQLSFLAHELGIRLLRSHQVNEYYYPLKQKELAKSTVLSDKQLTSCITQAFKYTLQEIDPKQTDYLLHLNKGSIETFLDYVITHKRTFIKAVNSKDLKLLLPQTFTEISLPNQKIQLDKKQLIQLTDEVYRESGTDIEHNPGELNKAKIKYGKNVQEKLKQFSFSSPIKEKIKTELLKQKTSISLSTFVDKYCSGLQQVQYTQIDKFYDKLEQAIYKAIKDKSHDYVERTVLPNSYTVDLHDDYDLVEMLSYIRLMTRSNLRLIKNLQSQDDTFADQPEIVLRTVKFPGIKSSVLEQQELYKSSGTRSDLVKTLASYSKIIDTIENIKKNFKVKDSDIANWVTSILNNNWIIPSAEISKTQQNNLEKFIISVVYLLFGTEVARNPASLIIHQMMLELIQEERLSWADAFKTASMPIENAVPASRWQHANYQSSYKYSYDKTQERVLAGDNVVLKNFVELEASIFKVWLQLKGIKLRSGINVPEVLEVLIKACNDWYQIDLKTKPIMIDLILYELDREELEDIEQLSIHDLIVLKEICSYSDSKRNLEILLDNNVEIGLIIQIYKENEEKFNALSDQRTIDLIRDLESDVSFEEMSEIYDQNEDKFFDLINDEEEIIREFGFEEVNNLYDALLGKYGSYDEEDGTENDIYQMVANKLKKENSYDYEDYSDNASASEESDIEDDSLTDDDTEHSSLYFVDSESDFGYHSDSEDNNYQLYSLGTVRNYEEVY